MLGNQRLNYDFFITIQFSRVSLRIFVIIPHLEQGPMHRRSAGLHVDFIRVCRHWKAYKSNWALALRIHTEATRWGHGAVLMTYCPLPSFFLFFSCRCLIKSSISIKTVMLQKNRKIFRLTK